MRLPSKAIYWITSGIMISATISILLLNYRGRMLQSSLASGLFERQYLSIIQQLHDEIFAVEVKLRGNNPAVLEIPKQDQIDALTPEPEIIIPAPDGNIVLSGIYLSDSTPLAQINGQLCEIGDRIDGFILEYIDSYKIRLSNQKGETKTVLLTTAQEEIR